MQNKYTLGVIGAGNMAYAIIDGILTNGLLKPSEIIISDVDDMRLALFAEKGISISTDNANVSTHCTHLILAVKPQIANTVFKQIADDIDCPSVISIMAGIPLKRLKNSLGERNYARVMPNTPALIGQGMSAIAFDGDADKDFVFKIFSSVGKVIQIDESLFDAVTSLSGSGPAYVYTFIQALINGGIEGGLDAETSKILALQTVAGATEMIARSPHTIPELINAVCSKGGTTIEAVNSFRNDSFEEIIKCGMEKCRDRSKELSEM